MRHNPHRRCAGALFVHFYMVALLFIFSISKPSFCTHGRWFISDLKVFGFVEMLLYIAILFVGYIYLWKKGALDWYSSPPSRNRTKYGTAGTE